MSDVIHVIRAAVDPTSAPTREGQHWVNTVTNKTWISVGIASVGDWQLVTDSNQVKASITDTTSGFLSNKLSAGTGISLSTINPGANEVIQISAPGSTTDESVKVSATDTTPGYLNTELTVSNGTNTSSPLEKSITSPSGNEKLNLQFDQSKISIGSSQVTDFTEASQDAIGASLTDTSSIDFTYNDIGNQISAVVLPAGVDHNSLNNFVANKHIDHSAVSISPGTGLSGGGDITATRTLSLANTTVTAASYGSASEVPTYSVDAQGRLTSASNTSIQITEAQVTNLSTDLSTKADKVTTITAGTGLSGGGDLSTNRTVNIAATGVTAATYGSTTQVPVIAVNAQGQATSVSNVSISIPSSAVSDFNESVDDRVAALVVAGTGITATYNDPANTLTIASTITSIPLATTAPQNVDKSAADVGVGTTSARADHKHDISTSTASNISTTNTEGSSTSLARADHTHKGVYSINGQFGAASLALGNISDVLLTSPATDDHLIWNGVNWVNMPTTVPVSAGAGVNIYFTNIPSGIGTYDIIQKTPDSAAEVIESVVVNNNTVLLEGYISDIAIDNPIIDAGIWSFNVYSYVSSLLGDSKIILDIYKRTSGGTETLLFNVDHIIDVTTVGLHTIVTAQPSFSINLTDKLVIKISASTTNTFNTSLYFIHSGTTHYSYISTPMITKHNDLAGLQGGSTTERYHLTISDVNKLAGIATGATVYTDEMAQDTIGNALVDSSSVDFTYNDVGNSITAVVLPAGVDHNSLQNFVANKHIDHGAVSMSAGTGLSGGGDLTSSRTISLANTSVTAASYGSAIAIPTFTVNSQGQLTAAATSTSLTPSAIGAQPADGDLTAVAGLAGTGIIVRTATDTMTTRTISASTGVTVSNGDGISGNPTISLSSVGTAGTYGSASQVPVITTNAQGQISSVTNTSIAITSTGVSDFVEAAQDAVGGILTDSTSIDFTYNDAGNSITAVVLPAGVNHNSLLNGGGNTHIDHSTVSILAGTGMTGGGDLTASRTISHANSGVTAGTYGSASQVPVITVDAQGHIDVVSIASIPSSVWVDAGGFLTWSDDTGKDLVIRQANAAAGSPYIAQVSSRGTLVSPTQNLSGDRIGGNGYYGWNPTGQNSLPSAAVNGYATENHSATANGGELRIEVIPNGSLTPVTTATFTGRGDLDLSGAIMIGDTTDTTNGNIRYNAATSEFQGRQAGVWIPFHQVPTYISSVSPIATTSATFSLVSSMSITPIAGTYKLDFTCAHIMSAIATTGDISVFIGGVEQTVCRRHTSGIATAAMAGTTAISTIVTVNGSQVLEIRFRENASGTLTINERELILTPLSR